MSIYGQDPDTGLPREPVAPDPVTDDQVTAQRVKATRARYNCLDVRALLARNQPAYAAALDAAVTACT